MSVSAPVLRPFERSGVPRPELGSRALFPELAFDAYLGHAAISPLSLAGREAVADATREIGLWGAGAFLRWDAQRARLRERLAELVGARSSEIALTAGTSHGATALALGIPLRAGDTLVTFEGEFPANVTPWQLAARARDAKVVLLPRPSAGGERASERVLEEVEGALKRGARYVAVSAVQFQTGFRMPLEELGRLCRAAGARLLVDGIQAAGVTPLDVRALGIDALFGGAHKWLLGLEGAGFLYVNEELQREITPLTAGWLSHEDGEHFLFRGAGHLRYDRPLKRSAQVFEGSSANVVGFAALEAGVDICLELGPARIFEHVQGYFDRIEPACIERGFRSLRGARPEERSTLLALEPPPGVSLPALAAGLRERKVMVSSPDGNVRLAPHFSNHPSELPLVLAALDEALKTARG